MKKIIMLILMVCGLITGCKSTAEVETFSFGEDLAFIESENQIKIDLENSSNIVKEKHKKLSEILNDEQILDDIVAVTTTTANILEQVGVRPTGAPESQSLSKTLQEQQYSVGNGEKIDKSKILNIGSAISPNNEAIVELNPKLVLYSDALPSTDFLKNIKSANIKVEALPQSDYVDMFVLLDVLGNVYNHQNEKVSTLMNEMVDALKEAVKITENATKKDQTIAILQVSEGSVRINNEASVLGRLTKALGMKNVFANSENAEVNKEQLLTANPDYIIFYAHGMGTYATESFEKTLKDSNSIYRELSAVKENKAFAVASDDFVFGSSVDFDIVKVIKFLAEKFHE